MATSKEVIELLFNAEYAGKAEVRALKRDLNDLSSDFSSGISTMSAFTLALGTMELAAVGASIGLAKAGVEVAGRFGDGFKEITTLIGDTDADLGKFKQSIRDYASGSTASLEDINGAIYNAISAGVDYKDSVEFLAAAEKLSIAGKTDLNSAVQILTGTLSAYGANMSEAGKYSDIMFASVASGVTTIPELVASLGQVTGTAASLGVSFEEVSAATATLTKNGINTSQSMTGLKALISNIIKPSKEAADVAEELGINLGTQALESKGLVGVLTEMATKTQGSTQHMSSLFGSVEALNLALILTSQKGLKSFQTDLDAMTKSAGATDGAVSKMEENLKLIKQTVANNIELTLEGIGEPLLDEFKDINKGIAEIFNQIRQNLGDGGALNDVISSVEGVAGTVATIISNMASNMDGALSSADLSGFTKSFDAINDAIKGLELGTEDGLASVISGIGKAFEGLTNFTLSAGEVLKGLLEVFGDVGSYLAGMDSEFLESAGSIGGWALVIGTATTVLSPFVTLLLTMKKMGGIVGAMGSASAVSALSKSVKGLGLAGAGAAVAWAGFEIGQNAVQAIDNITGLSDAMYGAKPPAEGLQKAMDEYAASIGKSSVTMSEYIAAMKKKNGANQEAVSTLNSMGDSLATVTLKTKLSAEEQARYNAFVADGYSWTGKANDALNQSIQAQDKNKASLKGLGQTANLSADDIKSLGDASETTKNALETLDNIKPVFDFQTAKVKSQAEEITSIMESLGASGESAGDALASAFGVFSSENYANLNVLERDAIESSIKEMTKSQSDLAAAQKSVADAKAEWMRAQAQAAANGDPLIAVDGTRLEPELEAFMFKIIESVQVQVAANKADFLTGMGS